MKIYLVNVCTNGCGVEGDYDYDHRKYFLSKEKAEAYAKAQQELIKQDVSVIEIEVIE